MSDSNVTSDGTIWIEKDKDARQNYAFKLDDVISAGDALASVAASASPAGMSIEDVSFSGKDVRCVFSGGTVGVWYAARFRWTSQAGLSDDFVVRVFVVADSEEAPQLGSGLFPNRFSATAMMRRDRLLAAAGVLRKAAKFSDDYLWEKLRVAESEIARTLRVPLVPTQFFPIAPTEAEISALNGMPWGIDPGYDMGPENNAGDRWGMISVRNKPIIDIQRYRFAYPAVDGMAYDVPLSWLRPDKKYGQISVVPASFSISVPLSGIVMQALSGGRTVPLMLQINYTAGLENVARDWPELLDAVKKLAVLKCIEDSFPPQSASVSGDGLSQSMSIDCDKYRETVDHILNGGKGSHGGLMTAIHGVRAMVF